MRANKALLQQRQLEKDYNNFKASNGANSYPFDAFLSGFNYGVEYEKMLVKNRTKTKFIFSSQGKTRKKK